MLLKQLVQDFTLDFDDKTATGEWGGGKQGLGGWGFQHGAVSYTHLTLPTRFAV